MVKRLVPPAKVTPGWLSAVLPAIASGGPCRLRDFSEYDLGEQIWILADDVWREPLAKRISGAEFQYALVGVVELDLYWKSAETRRA